MKLQEPLEVGRAWVVIAAAVQPGTQNVLDNRNFVGTSDVKDSEPERRHHLMVDRKM